MKKNIFKITILIILIFILLNYLNLSERNKENENTINEAISDIEKDYLDMTNNSIMYDSDADLKELKEEYKITGQDEIYEINTENDGRKILNVKPSVNYKVAFCGMIKKAKPNFEELDLIFEQNSPTKSGIWINNNDREKIKNYLNNNQFLESKYDIDENGYLIITQANNQTSDDKKIEKLINSDSQYIFNISSTCYMVDVVTGEIVENPYNDLEEYQTYEYFKDQNRMIIFITENKDLKMTNEDIFESLIDLFNSIE